MSGYPRPIIPNKMQWHRQQAPYNPHYRPFFEPRVPFRPRDREFSNHRMPIHEAGEEHWCETCDRGFPSEDLLSQHKQQHQKCNIDGCQFVAHPKVITKHIQMQHSTGLYKKIAKLNNPEEVEKWREERRKKYPTKINIDNKAAALKEKLERGEKINLERKEWHKRIDNDHNRHSNPGPATKRSYKNTNNEQPESKFRKANRKQPQRPKDLPLPEENRSLVPFAGIQCLGMDNNEEFEEDLISNDLIEDDEVGTINNDMVCENDLSKIIEKPVVCSALSSLMCDYGSSDEEIDAIEKPIKEIIYVDLKGKSCVIKKEGELQRQKDNISLQTKKSNENMNEIHEIKGINEFNRNLKEKTLLRQNCITETTVSSEILQRVGTKHGLIENKVEINDHSHSNGTDIIVKKCETAIKLSDSDSKSNELAVIKDCKPASSEKNDAIANEYDDDSGPEEVKVDKKPVIIANVVPNHNAGTKNKVVKKKTELVKRKPFFRKPKPKIPSTLIYRLLSKEMKQERNQILQCIRYIRKNNYFDKSNS